MAQIKLLSIIQAEIALKQVFGATNKLLPWCRRPLGLDTGTITSPPEAVSDFHPPPEVAVRMETCNLTSVVSLERDSGLFR